MSKLTISKTSSFNISIIPIGAYIDVKLIYREISKFITDLDSDIYHIYLLTVVTYDLIFTSSFDR